MTQLVKCPTLGFSSGRGFTVCEFKPLIGLCTGSAEPAWDSLSPLALFPSLTHGLSLSLSLSLSQNKLKKRRKERKKEKGKDKSRGS